MSLIRGPSGLICALWLLCSGPLFAADTGSDAREMLSLETRADGKCQNLSEGGQLVVLRSASPRAIRYRLIRYFADVPQSPTVGTLSAEAPEQPLGCNRVDGRVQRWGIQRARYEERKAP